MPSPHGVATPRAYRCSCGRQVFFRNSRCLACEAPLGYVPSLCGLFPMQAGADPDTWQIASDEAQPQHSYRRCGNFATAAACNWLIEPEDSAKGAALCRACRLNRTIPDLSQGRNRALWLGMERAKRRLVSQLIGLGLPVASKVSEDLERGLAYDFLSDVPGHPRVMTGHTLGIMTINLDEADDVVRERARVDMGEPYRTLLGHFRHEIGHYYWTRLIERTPWRAPCRRLFGDERKDYASALKAHYEQGPQLNWRERFVSAYASVHPSEDWAESWAHYLHLRDTLDTAASFGMEPHRVEGQADTFGIGHLWRPRAGGGRAFLDMLHRWVRITGAMNEMSRAMGQQDFYPFVLPPPAVAKLHFIHCAVTGFPGGPPLSKRSP